MHESELDLARRIARGDQMAFEQVIDLHADSLFKLAAGLMGNQADAEDLMQEAMLVIYSRISSFQGRSSLKTWMYRIVLNKASKARRYRRLRETQAFTDRAGQQIRDPALQRSTAATGVEARMDVMTMLSELSEDYRQVLVLRELNRLTYEEIARTLEIPVGTVESRLYRARQELKRKFDGYFS